MLPSNKFMCGEIKCLNYMNQDWRKAIRCRNKLWKIFTKERNQINYAKYKIQRNKCTSIRRKAIKEYFLRKAEAKSPREFWNAYRLFLHTRQSKQANDIILKEDDIMITNKKQIANIFNDYFSHIMDGFCEMNEQESDTDFSTYPSIKAIIENTDKRSVVDRFKFCNVNEAQIRVLLSEINTRKSCGNDFLSPRLIKESAQEIAGPFAHIINISINQCQYPQRWKMGQLTPLFKKEDDLNKTYYRPITVLPCLNNIFERVLSCQLDKFYNEILVDYISSYRKHYRCETSLLRLFEDWKKSLDNKETVAVISMDLSKAFDAIPHALLLAKLKAYGLGVNASTLISSYLCGRFPRVKIGDAYSKWEKVTKGVPQGSVLGPMFFNIFLNDLFYHINTIKLNAYADDEQLYDSDKDPVALEKLRSALKMG